MNDINSSEPWQIIEGDSHVISFTTHGLTEVFKTGQIREKVASQVKSIVDKILVKGTINVSLAQSVNIRMFFSILNVASFFQDGIKDCEILLLGSQAWQKGRLKTSFLLKPIERNTNTELNYQEYKCEVILEFLPEFIEQIPADINMDAVSSLDNICQEIYQ